MYVDSLTLFSDGQDLSQSTGDFYSSNSIDMGSTLDPGAGETVNLIICVDEAFTSSSSTATVKFSLVDEEDATIDSGSVEIVSTDTIIVTTLTLGKVLVIPIPAGLITQQFLGVRYDIGTDTTTAGTVTAFLGTTPQMNI